MISNFCSRTVFFTNALFSGMGGMEIHQYEFLRRVNYCITKEEGFTIFYKQKKCKNYNNFHGLIQNLKEIVQKNKIQYFFFNNLSWIKLLTDLKNNFPTIKFIIRSGGNDIFRAPLDNDEIPLVERQSFIKNTINAYIDYFIVNSDFSYLRSIEYGINPLLIKKIRGGVNSQIAFLYSFFKTFIARKTKKQLKAERKIVLLFACRLKSFKGILQFLNELKNVNQKHFFILFIGKGELQNEIINFLDFNCPNVSYKFLGELPNKQTLKYIAGVDFLINTSLEEKRFFDNDYYIHTETMGRSLMEAISEKTPVIATKVGGTKELILENGDIGFFVDSFSEIPSILNSLITKHNHNQNKQSDYSWNFVFKRYSYFFCKNNNYILVLDLDGTLIDEKSNLCDIKTLICKNKRKFNFILILNTARQEDEKTVSLGKYLCADCLITENGMNIRFCTTLKNIMWNQEDFLRKTVINKIDSLYYEFQTWIPKGIIKKTHPHIIQIKNQNDNYDMPIVEKINTQLRDSEFIVRYDDKNIKVFSKYLSKAAALNYILKDLSYKKIFAAGNGLNDLDFIEMADFGWIHERESNFSTKKNLKIFSDGDVGYGLLKKMFAVLEGDIKC